MGSSVPTADETPESLLFIQQHDHRAAQVPQQLTEKNANLLLPDVIEVKLIVQAQALSVLGPTRIRTKLLHLGPTLAGGIARCHSKRRIVKTLMARAVARIGSLHASKPKL